ncbi:MAG: hypothetical protein KJP25_01945 [Gammaproteobacteria bacterium]|nr:hypothetical protein [Gammaproteobacteria bacterium]
MQDTHEGAQRFYARDMGTAMKMLSDAFGADALLLSSKRVGSGVEVLGLPPSPGASHELQASQSADRAQRRRVHDNAERRQSDRRRAERRAGDANPANEVREQGVERGEAVGDSGGAAQRRQFGDTLAKLSSEHAALFGQRERAEAGSAESFDHSVDMREAASALAERIGSLLGERPATDSFTAASSGQDASIQSELRAMRAMLDEKLQANPSQSMLPEPERYLVQHRLQRMGLSAAVCSALMETVEGDDVAKLWSDCRQKLAALVPIVAREALQGSAILALLGPAAAGKSSVASMLLARAVAAGEIDSIALFHLDGARDARLAELAELAGVAFTALRSADSLREQLAGSAHKRLLLIDMPADQPLPKSWRQEADALQLRELLVLPATGDARFLREVVRRHRSERTFASVLSFYQRATALGEVLSLLLSERLPLAWLTKGAVLPEHLCDPDADSLLQDLGFAGDCPAHEAVLAPLVTEPASTYLR